MKVTSASKRGGRRQVEALRTYIKLFRATSSLTAQLSQVLAAQDLTMTQYNVLDTLLHKGSMRQRELGGKAMKSDGNIVFVLVNLEKMGLVERKKTEGTRRDLTVSLTPIGLAKIEKVYPLFAQVVEERMRVLTTEELETLGELCKRIGLGLKSATSTVAASSSPESTC